ncbi:MAG: YraN family protein [Gemmatimonadota bacterium]|nr:YraN family protein [Gemmatimonadota bacterium]
MALSPRYGPHDLGAWGERIAAARLKDAGWCVADANVRLGRREIDLVIRRPRVIAFVEVKTRSGADFGSPAEAVNWRKRREIEAVAAWYLDRRELADIDVRFDVVAIVAGPGRRVVHYTHIEDAWRPGW